MLKKKQRILLAALLGSSLALADPEVSRTLDFSATSPAKQIDVFQKNVKTLRITLQDNGTNLNLAAYSPVFYFYLSNTCVTASVSWVASSNGIFDVSLTTNNLLTAGTFTYGGGVSNSTGVTISQRGVFVIKADPNP